MAQSITPSMAPSSTREPPSPSPSLPPSRNSPSHLRFFSADVMMTTTLWWWRNDSDFDFPAIYFPPEPNASSQKRKHPFSTRKDEHKEEHELEPPSKRQKTLALPLSAASSTKFVSPLSRPVSPFSPHSHPTFQPKPFAQIKHKSPFAAQTKRSSSFQTPSAHRGRRKQRREGG